MLRLEVNSVGEKEGAEGGQRTGKVTENGGKASAQIIGLRGVPSQRTSLLQAERRSFTIVLLGNSGNDSRCYAIA